MARPYFIMKRLDANNRVIPALVRFKRTQDGIDIIAWLNESLVEQHDNNDNLEGLQETGKGQGKALAIKEFLDCVDKADEALQRSRK